MIVHLESGLSLTFEQIAVAMPILDDEGFALSRSSQTPCGALVLYGMYSDGTEVIHLIHADGQHTENTPPAGDDR